MSGRKPSRAIAVQPTPYREPVVTEADLRQRDDTIELLQESIVDLERAMMEPGWTRMTAIAEQEFSPEGLRQIRAACRIFGLANPLIKRGLALRSAYVHGQGVEISARANGKEGGEQDVQAVVEDFLTDPGNLRTLTGPEAHDQLERALGTDGNVFLACFTDPVSGRVQTRIVPCDEIADVVSNPDDASEPWFYRRRWYRNDLDVATGRVMPTPQECFYPAMGYRPTGKDKPRYIGGWQVRWDAPVIHVAVNRPLHWQFGIPDAYAALDWARAYRDFLEDWARLMRSLSRYAWKATTGGTKAAAVKKMLGAQPSRNGEPNSGGASLVLPPDVALEAVSKSGATIDADSGRPIATMVASALGVPVTMLLSDPGQTGARATAETLDQPTELEMSQRRDLWTSVHTQLMAYVIGEAVRAPKGSLKGQFRTLNGREYLTLNGDTVQTVDITWPDLKDTSLDVLSDAIMKANSTGVMPPEIVLRLILTTFGVRGVDELIENMTDDNGDFIWPKGAPLSAGQQLAALAKAGGDPAQSGTGPMAGDDEEPDDNPDDGEQPGDKAPASNGG